MSRSEARKRKQALASLQQADKQSTSQARKAANASRRARMLAGDDSVLPEKDRGPVRRYARSVIDGRRSVSNYLLPILFVCLVFSLLLSGNVTYAAYASPVTMAILVVLLLDAAYAGWIVVRKVKEKFPKEKINARSLAFYGFVRSTQLRRMRMPAPVSNPKDSSANAVKK